MGKYLSGPTLKDRSLTEGRLLFSKFKIASILKHLFIFSSIRLPHEENSRGRVKRIVEECQVTGYVNF